MSKFRAFRLFEASDKKAKPEGRLVEMDVDELPAGEVLVRTEYSSVNFKDALAAHGINRIIRQFPRIGGIDLVGKVAASSDARFKEGDAVIVHGFGIGVDHDGGHAQYARVPADWVLPLPAGFSAREAAIVGVAGYTAALSIHLMELNGLTPASGKVLVNGATGGVGSVAIDMLAARGYAVTALTGKAAERAYLERLGASEVLPRGELQQGDKPLEKALWAGAVDSVGGDLLAWLTRTMQPEGVIAAFGNAGGMELKTTVLPFILRGVRLLGVNANSPMPLRRVVWDRIAGDLRPRHAADIGHAIGLEGLPAAFERLLQGGARGRTIVELRNQEAT
jgi:putative YhdH/YhfP family quinone oxidoreductase